MVAIRQESIRWLHREDGGLMGGTPVDFYDPYREDPILCKAGEYIRFVPITIGDYYDIRHMIEKESIR